MLDESLVSLFLDPHYRQLNASFSKQTMIGFKPDNVKLAPGSRKLLICAARSGSSEFKLQLCVISGKLKLALLHYSSTANPATIYSLRCKGLAKNKFVDSKLTLCLNQFLPTFCN